MSSLFELTLGLWWDITLEPPRLSIHLLRADPRRSPNNLLRRRRRVNDDTARLENKAPFCGEANLHQLDQGLNNVEFLNAPHKHNNYFWYSTT